MGPNCQDWGLEEAFRRAGRGGCGPKPHPTTPPTVAPPPLNPPSPPPPRPHLKGSFSPQHNLRCLPHPLRAEVPATLIKGPSPRLGFSTAPQLLAPQNE